MFRFMRHHLPSSGRDRHRLVPCNCFDLVPLLAFVKIDMPQFNLIIAACALPHLFYAKDFGVSTHGQHAFERQPLFESAMLCRVRDGHLLSDPVGEIPSV